MVVLVIVMVVCVGAGAAVLGYVAWLAREDSREFWTPQGERLIAETRRRGGELKDRGDDLAQRAAAVAARGRTSSAGSTD